MEKVVRDLSRFTGVYRRVEKEKAFSAAGWEGTYRIARWEDPEEVECTFHLKPNADCTLPVFAAHSAILRSNKSVVVWSPNPFFEGIPINIANIIEQQVLCINFNYVRVEVTLDGVIHFMLKLFGKTLLGERDALQFMSAVCEQISFRNDPT